MITDEEIEKAIKFIEDSRITHVDWINYIENYPDDSKQPAPRVETAGDIDHHEAVIKKYDYVISLLNRLKK
jgi:hypothetical protein